MGNFARKIIGGFQNLFLDRLFLRVFPLWWIGSLWEKRQPDQYSGAMLPVLFSVFALFAIAWGLGVVANSRPLLREGPLPWLQVTPPSGFGAWSEPPAGGLRPPSFLRRVVIILGHRSTGPIWTPLVGLAAFVSAGILLSALAYNPEAFWADLHPALSNSSARDALWTGTTAVVVLMVLRHWASEQLDRLEPPEDRRGLPEPDWVPFSAFSMLVLMMVALLCISFRWPFWIVATPFLPLAVVAFVPEWRKTLLDTWFGKRVDSEEPRSKEPSAP